MNGSEALDLFSASAVDADASSPHIPQLPVRPQAGPHGGIWDATLTRRHHGLLYMVPIITLDLNQARRGDDIAHYDALAIVVKMFDLIVANTGLAEEMDADRLLAELAPMLSRMDECRGQAPDPRAHEAIVGTVLNWLRNDKEARAPHQQSYISFDADGAITPRALHFRLIEDRFRPDGRVVLRLSNQAVNIFLRSLDEDVEDAQAAAEALVDSQIRRGKFEEAQASAQAARYQSIRYQSKIMDILERTRRDIRQVDWGQEVPALLEDARVHTELRENVEVGIMSAAEERLVTLEPGSDDARHVAEVRTLMRDCYLRHSELLRHIRRARPLYMDEQGRQIFRPVPLHLRPSLTEDILAPLLAMPAAHATVALDLAFAQFAPLAAPGLLDLGALLRWQLRPKRPPRTDSVENVERDSEIITTDLARYPLRVQLAGDAILESLARPTRLSDLAVRLLHEGEDPALVEYVILRGYHLFAPEPEERLPVRASRIADETFDCAGHSGDDLLLTPLIRIEAARERT